MCGNDGGWITRNVFITGGTGFMGRHLIPALLARGHRVAALARPGTEPRFPSGVRVVTGDALDGGTYSAQVAPADTFVHLVGVSHPNPSKGWEFQRVDLGSLKAAVPAAKQASVAHFVFVSVAQPAPLMKSYLAVRAECEQIIAASGMNATILRPWYVLGPGRWWPYLLLPGYWLAELFPITRDSARRLGLVTWRQMMAAMVHAVEDPPNGMRVLEVPQIRKSELIEVTR